MGRLSLTRRAEGSRHHHNPVTQQVSGRTATRRGRLRITKVMTAVVFSRTSSTRREVEISPRHAAAVRPTCAAGARAPRRRAAWRSASGNVAARTPPATRRSATRLHRPMNEKAEELGLTALRRPIGPAVDNLSSARDGAADRSPLRSRLQVMRKADHTLRTSRRTLTVRNMNKLVGPMSRQGGKTDSSRAVAIALRPSSGCPRAISEWRWSCSARSQRRAVGGPSTCSTGSPKMPFGAGVPRVNHSSTTEPPSP
jgi:hypothetical protein